jgi:hypothetical protein
MTYVARDSRSARQITAVVLFAAVTIFFSACGDGDHAPPAPAPTPTPTPQSVNAYQLGELDGVLAAALKDVLQPAPWKGQTDALVIMAGASVAGLTTSEQNALRDAAEAAQPIVLTNATGAHIEALSQILGESKPVDPPSTTPPYDHFDLVARARGSYGTRVLTLMPPNWDAVATSEQPNPEEPAAHRHVRAEALPRWISRALQPYPPPLQLGTESGELLEIYGTINSYSLETDWSAPYVWATAGIDT